MLKIVIFAGGESQYHDLLAGGAILQRLLLNRGLHAVLRQDFSLLNREESKQFDLYIFYTHDKLLTDKQQEALATRIKEGKGFLPVHAASVITKPGQQRHLELVGSKFIEHDPFKRFKVEIEQDHFITNGVGTFNIEDELYVSEYVREPEKVLATAEQDGKKHPMLYINHLKQGRICYLALGHDGRAWYNPGFQKLFYRSVLWCGKKETAH
ncbi:MAG: ThuA domain-containing protein [Halanaerobiales bacterium]